MRSFGLLLVFWSAASCGSRTALPVERSAQDAAPQDAAIDPCATTVRGTLRLTADDQCRVFMNGVLLDAKTDKWWNVRSLDVTVRHGRNSIAVEATNMWSQDGIDRGFIAELRVGWAIVSSGTTWKVSKVLVPGWETATFDAKGWRWAVNEGLDGIKPYGSVLGSNRAWWLWSYDSNVPVASKPDMETVWLRHDFWLEPNGALSDSPLGCP